LSCGGHRCPLEWDCSYKHLLEAFALEAFALEAFALEAFALEAFALEAFALEAFAIVVHRREGESLATR
jgi:hypothetical protein